MLHIFAQRITNKTTVQKGEVIEKSSSSSTLNCQGIRKGMVIASLYVNSLPAHTDEIRLLLPEKNIHILALNETKIDSDYASEVLKIEGYRFDTIDCNRREGGIGLYIRDTFEVEVREDISV